MFVRTCHCFLVAVSISLLGAAPVGAAGLFQPADSDTINAATARALKEPIDVLRKDVEHLHPVAMMFLAKRLSDAGQSDQALFWFYEAQLRWRAHISDQFESDMFQRLFSDIGPDINHFAGRHVPIWLKTIDDVLAWDAQHPDDFTPAGPNKDAARDGLAKFKDYIIAHRAELDQKAAEEDRMAGTPSPDDPYPGSGGALFGTPQEMVPRYDPERYDGFKVGVTSKKDVVQALGKPEMWDTNPDGSSELSYPVYLTGGTASVLGMVKRVSVSFTFDAKKILTKITLPSEKDQ
jgi:hypothetical protein